MRKQRPRGATTLEAIVDAALTLADATGVRGVKIRAVAGVVGAPPMSLYTHFRNKDELLDLMYSEVSRRLYIDSGNATWQAELLALCDNVQVVLSAHPRWSRAPGASRRPRESRGARAADADDGRRWTRMADGDPDLPITRSALSKLARFDFGTLFSFAVRTLIAGVEDKRVRPTA